MAKSKKNLVVEEVVVEEAVVEYVADETTLETDMEVTDEATEVEKAPKANKEKKSVPVITLMDNDGMKQLFHDNGCGTKTNASNESKVVYNTFNTQSRVLQQNKAYQLLLTNGHKKVKEQIIDCDNDDTARFIGWYETLSDGEKSQVSGYDALTSTKLSLSELPRERSVKLTSYDLLVKFIQFMGTFPENQMPLVVNDRTVVETV